jgi:hypothetical protein
MPERKAHDERARRWRERLSAAAAALFPLLVVSGFFAPGFVQWLAIAQPNEPPAASQLSGVGGPTVPTEKPPLVVPRDFSGGLVPELLDLDQLFLDDSTDPLRGDLPRVKAFERNSGDVIAIDDVGQPNVDIDFPDALIGDREPDDAKVAQGDEIGVLPLCGTLYAANCLRDDDFSSATLPSSVTVIPEPSPGLLVGLGLLALSWLRRYFQPITS